jgi:fatty acid desaturase
MLSAACGVLYGSLFFLGHEVGHGAVVRSHGMQTLLMWPAFTIFLLSPTLWRVWHNRVHHQHTNRDTHDPDNFGALGSYLDSRAVRFTALLTPGSGRWPSLLYLPTWFTVHSQIVLWRQSRHCRGFESLNRPRAIIESAAMAAFWCGLGAQLGAWAALEVIVVPMLVANASIMSYIVTNHLLRPLVEENDPLASSMSVTTHRLLDLVHFNFSHHTEHHLFPAMSSKYLPLVRAGLRRHAGGHYLAPPHWKALLMVFRTPRIHAGNGTLVDPASGRAVSVDRVTEALAAADPGIAAGAPVDSMTPG